MVVPGESRLIPLIPNLTGTAAQLLGESAAERTRSTSSSEAGNGPVARGRMKAGRVTLRPSVGASLVWLLAACTAAAGCAIPVRTDGGEPPPRAVPASFAVYALSRGRGVPAATRSAWQAVWMMLEDARREGKVTRLEQTRIGLEGEVRLCAEFSDAGHAREMLERAREIGKGVELLNVVEESCSRR